MTRRGSSPTSPGRRVAGCRLMVVRAVRRTGPPPPRRLLGTNGEGPPQTSRKGGWNSVDATEENKATVLTRSQPRLPRTPRQHDRSRRCDRIDSQGPRPRRPHHPRRPSCSSTSCWTASPAASSLPTRPQAATSTTRDPATHDIGHASNVGGIQRAVSSDLLERSGRVRRRCLHTRLWQDARQHPRPLTSLSSQPTVLLARARPANGAATSVTHRNLSSTACRASTFPLVMGGRAGRPEANGDVYLTRARSSNVLHPQLSQLFANDLKHHCGEPSCRSRWPAQPSPRQASSRRPYRPRER